MRAQKYRLTFCRNCKNTTKSKKGYPDSSSVTLFRITSYNVCYTKLLRNFQYNLHLTSGSVKNNISVGADFKSQNIDMHKLQSAANLNRVESTDETNIETDSLMANQLIKQQTTGVFALYKLEVSKFTLMGSVRYDNLTNKLTDKMMGSDTSYNFV